MCGGDAVPGRAVASDSRVAPNADRAVIRAHLRLLLTWLHPDKNSSAWHAPFARRVIAAWRQIDSGLEDEQPRGWLAHRVPWIASPLEATRQRSRWRASKGLRVFLAGVALIWGRHGAR